MSNKNKRKTEEGYLRQQKFARTVVDYQPDICKDYKETGFCGFGDSCKFLHDRSDHKQSWQETEEDEPDDKYLIKDEEEDKSACCPICDQDFTDPIITKCKHIFCLKCAEKECEKLCFVCKKATSGIFKNASKLLKK